MKNLLVFSFFIISLQVFGQAATNKQIEEKAVKTFINNFLVAIGNYDIEAMRPMFAEKSNVSGSYLVDGKWNSFTITVEEFFEQVKSEKDPKKYEETVDDWIVHIDDDRLAFVRANATLKVDGKKKSHNIDYFTLVKENGEWKILNGAYLSKRLESGK